LFKLWQGGLQLALQGVRWVNDKHTAGAQASVIASRCTTDGKSGIKPRLFDGLAKQFEFAR
jgi:hypothetical protein